MWKMLLLWLSLLNESKGKVLYKMVVKVFNKEKLNRRSDTPWRAHLGLADKR